MNQIKISYQDFFFLCAILTMIVISVFVNQADYADHFIHRLQEDEKAYYNIIQDWNKNGLHNFGDNKPLTFLYLQKLLDGDYIKTRAITVLKKD